MPDDFFRIRLVCTMLDFCGGYFDRGSAKKKLDFFLTFFQVQFTYSSYNRVPTNLNAVLRIDKGALAYGH